MKKLFLFIGFITLSFLSANAQDISKNAIGLRFGDNSGFGAEISYQRKLKDVNRLEVDFGFRNNSLFSYFRGTGLYQWVMPIENNFNWYFGVGGGLGAWTIKEQLDFFGDPIPGTGTTDLFFFAAGDIGIEYNFDIPLIISLDFRPEIGFNNTYDGFNSDIALALRYQF